MPRSMVGLKNREEERSRCSLSLDEKSKSRQTESVRDPMLRERVLRKNRSKRYMDMMCKLDTGNTKLDSGAAEKLIDGIRAEFPEIVGSEMCIRDRDSIKMLARQGIRSPHAFSRT